MAITYHTQDCDFKYRTKRATSAWIKEVAKMESASVGEISIVFCYNNYILEVNNKYLQHDYFTDIITFDYSIDNEGIKTISGDLIISIETVKSNAETFNQPFETELQRVIIHGVLHLLGYKDKQNEEQKIMRAKEDYYLALLNKN